MPNFDEEDMKLLREITSESNSEDDHEIFYVIEDSKIMCYPCGKKVFDCDWACESEKWDAGETMKHTMHWINEHIKENHKLQ